MKLFSLVFETAREVLQSIRNDRTSRGGFIIIIRANNKWVIEDVIIYNMAARINVISLTCLFSLLFEVYMSFLKSKSGNFQNICMKYLKGTLSIKSFKHTIQVS